MQTLPSTVHISNGSGDMAGHPALPPSTPPPVQVHMPATQSQFALPYGQV
jgi:hypothetical protein